LIAPKKDGAIMYLSDKALAARYDVARPTIWKWVREGRFPKPHKLTDGCTRWKLEEIEAFEKVKASKPEVA
jgi:prophage regulatory protein